MNPKVCDHPWEKRAQAATEDTQIINEQIPPGERFTLYLEICTLCGQIWLTPQSRQQLRDYLNIES